MYDYNMTTIIHHYRTKIGEALVVSTVIGSQRIQTETTLHRYNGHIHSTHSNRQTFQRKNGHRH